MADELREEPPEPPVPVEVELTVVDDRGPAGALASILRWTGRAFAALGLAALRVVLLGVLANYCGLCVVAFDNGYLSLFLLFPSVVSILLIVLFRHYPLGRRW